MLIELAAVLFILIMAGRILPNIFRDDSDEQKFWGKRSGLIIHTDYATGLQYLESELGGLTPRMNPDGTQMRNENGNT